VLSVVLLVGSSLLLLSFVKLQQTPPGFEARGAATAFVGVPATKYSTPAQQAQFFDRVIERLRADPRVTSAAVAIGLPLSGFNSRFPYAVGGRPVLPLPQRPLANLGIVSEDYFKVMRITLVAGRAFTEADREGSPGVCIVNESLARRLFPGESPLGKIMLRGRDAEVQAEIVGVIRDVKTNGLSVPAPDEVYYPYRQLARPGMAVVARTEGDAAALQPVMRSAVAEIDKDQPISIFATLENNVWQSLGAQRIVASLTAAFAGLALALSAVGLYSVLAYAVSQRTSELGIRMALGAQPGDVRGMVVRQAVRTGAVGIVLGLAAAPIATRVLSSLLFGVSPNDPATFAGVAATLVAVLLAAAYLPARRATRVDPMLALRTE
jgi:predicted permease